MRIIGIDPGTAITGFSILEQNRGNIKLLDYGCIRTSKNLKPETRLSQLASDLETLINRWQPQKASIEKLFFNKNIKTAMSVAQARGVITHTLDRHGISLSEYSPSEIKMAVCGYGKADKKMVQQMVKILLKMRSTPQPDDAADAIAAAICGANTIPLS